MKKQIFIICGLIVLILTSLAVIAARVLFAVNNKTAKIYQNGELIQEINLDDLTESVEFKITGKNGCKNTVRAEHGRICMLDADCPDKICVNTGWISNGVIPIVCLPNKLTIEISGGKNDIDSAI